MKSNVANTLEDLRKSLKMTTEKMQKSLDNREIGILSRVYDFDENGKPAFVVWECRLPSGDGGERRHEMLRLPWDSFYQCENVLAELSVEIECDINKEMQIADDSGIPYRLRPVKSGLIRRIGKQPHKVKLSLEADNNFDVEATVEGIPLDDFFDETDALAQESQAPIYKKIWSGLKNMASGWLIFLVLLITTALTVLLWLRNSGHI